MIRFIDDRLNNEFVAFDDNYPGLSGAGKTREAALNDLKEALKDLRPRFAEERRAQALALKKAGATFRSITETLGVSTRSLQNWMK